MYIFTLFDRGFATLKCLFSLLRIMMMSIGTFGPVGCWRTFRGARCIHINRPFIDDDADNKPVWPQGLWAPSSEVRDVSTLITYVVKITYSFVIEESEHPR
jgi:hypothetical protein